MNIGEVKEKLAEFRVTLEIAHLYPPDFAEIKKLNKKINELHQTVGILNALNEITPSKLKWMTEVLVCDERKWRYDFAHPAMKLAIEINGGVYTQGRHVRGEGFKGDMQKLNSAQLRGWTVLQYTPAMLKAMLRDVKLYIDKRGKRP